MKKVNVLILALILISGATGLLIAQTTASVEPGAQDEQRQKQKQQEQSIKQADEDNLDVLRVPRTSDERRALAQKLFPNDQAAQKSFEAETDRFALRNIIFTTKQQRRDEDRPRLLSESPSAQVLEEQANRQSNQNGREKVLRDAGNTDDKSLIPYLKFLVFHENSKEAAIALVNLGETEYFDQMLAESESDKPLTKFDGVYKLTHVGLKGNKRAMQRLYELLDPDEKATSDGAMVFVPLSDSLVGLLADLVPNPPTRKTGKQAILLWRKWFETNGFN